MISLARETITPRLGRSSIFSFRVILSLVWVWSGIWSHILHYSAEAYPHHLSLGDAIGISPVIIAICLGALEIILAVWLLSGWTHRICCIVQVLFLIFLFWYNYQNLMGWLTSLVNSLPFMAMIVMIWWYGPGNMVWSKKHRRATWTRG